MKELAPESSITRRNFIELASAAMASVDIWSDFWKGIHWHSNSRSIAIWSGVGLLVSALIQRFT